MLISKKLVVDVFSIIFALTSRLILVGSQKGLFLVNEGVESFEGVSGIFIKFLLNELFFLDEHILDRVYIHMFSSKNCSALGSGNLILELAALVKEQARHVAVLKVLDTLRRLDHHELASWVSFCQLYQNFLQ
jgi:hypothetical protein